jgi:hypothetical protein
MEVQYTLQGGTAVLGAAMATTTDQLRLRSASRIRCVYGVYKVCIEDV